MSNSRESPWRFFAVVALAAVLVWLSSPVLAACQAQTELETTVPPESAATGWCLAGVIKSGDEPHVKFALPAAGLWRVTLEALPGQVGLALLTSEGESGSHEIWQGATPRS